LQARSPQIPSDPLRSCQILSDPFRSFQILSHPLRSSQILSDPLRSSQILSDPLRSSQITCSAKTGKYPPSSGAQKPIEINHPEASQSILVVENKTKKKTSYPLRSSPILSYPLRSSQILSDPLRSSHILSDPLRSSQILQRAAGRDTREGGPGNIIAAL
jgi:hypothetical protein